MSHSSVTISLARVADAVGIQDVYYRGWLETYPNTEIGISREDIEDSFKDRYSEAKLRALKERLGGSLQADVTFVARSSVRIVGVCRVMRHDDCNELRSIYVLKEYIGKGVGSHMWSTARDFLD